MLVTSDESQAIVPTAVASTFVAVLIAVVMVVDVLRNGSWISRVRRAQPEWILPAALPEAVMTRELG
jgi:hypothetical protein